MNQHPYLRAYMAGIVVPTVFLLVAMSVYVLVRLVHRFPLPIERVIVFPMAIVPNLWGVWNMLYVLLHGGRRLPIGLHGALLPILLAPLGFTMARILVFEPMIPVPSFLFVGFPVAVALYYLAWKYLVGFFNELLGIA